MKRMFLLSTICLCLLCGCSNNNSRVSYEDMFNKMVANAPKEYEEAYRKETEAGFNEVKTYLTTEFEAFINEECLEKMNNEQTLDVFYKYTVENDVKISCEEIKIDETQENHYSFNITYVIENKQGAYQGIFQTDDEGKINYFRVNKLDLQ